MNPYILIQNDYSDVNKKGLKIEQKNFFENLEKVNYRSVYECVDDLFYQINIE